MIGSLGLAGGGGGTDAMGALEGVLNLEPPCDGSGVIVEDIGSHC